MPTQRSLQCWKTKLTMSQITYQDYGTAILLFIQGKNDDDAQNKWLSIFNWGATSSEPHFVAPNVIACWSTRQKFQRYLFNIHENRIWNNPPKNVKGFMDDVVLANALAQAEFDSIPRETFRSVNCNNLTPYEMGVIVAEKPDEDFSDAVLNFAFSNR